MPRTVADIFRSALPPDVVVDDRRILEQKYLSNVTALSREVPVVLRPSCEEDVRRIIAVAIEHRTPLYPFSTGKNWGLGSKLPVLNGCALVDMSRMTRIVEVNEEVGYAILEPGVTQLQLATYLRERHPGLTMNFTGSFGLTSIVGNTLERGDGLSARVHDLLGVRGFLGTGDPFHAGGVWSNVGTSEPSHFSKYVAGPDLSTFFTQSSFGIVTQLAFKLIHRRPRRHLVWGMVPDARLDAAVAALQTLGQHGVIESQCAGFGYGNRFAHARDAFRAKAAQPFGEELPFFVVVSGSRRTADAAAADVLEAMAPHCSVSGAFAEDDGPDAMKAIPAVLHPIVAPFRGGPDVDSIKFVYEATGTPIPEDPRELNADVPPWGMKSTVFVIPFSVRHVRTVERIIAKVSEHGVDVKPSMTCDGRVLVTLTFRRDVPEEVTRAERADAALWDAMIHAGFAPYRVAIDRMNALVDRDPTFFDVVKRIKSALDPHGIVSPGRYCRA